ncbi:LapA family protein [Streptococcus cristatus]|uniref:LapA family protein n=1 Tax=Streptococcus cristatus TaxID=45634 RepID=A0A5B0DBI6_STRCR|nr:LapA family protein [Streptococcus cristatus]KAA0964007.1 LapA family protein [Streptococcus cristatus]
MKEKLHYILLLITILLLASISLANMQSVNVSFILFSFKLPLIILILVSVLLGSVTTFLISMSKNFSLKKELKKTKESLKTSQKEN